MNGAGFGYFADQEPDAAAIIDATGRTWSRGELSKLVNALSCALRASGLRRGDVVAIIAPNCPQFLAVYLAATQVGLYVVPINWHLAPPEIAHILSDSETKAVIAHEKLGTRALANVLRVAAHVPLRVSIGRADGFMSLEDFIAPHSGSPAPAIVLGRVMMYTSATTGRPKGVLLPLPDSDAALERTICFHASARIGLGRGHVNLCASMLYHGAPLEAAIISLHMGHTVVMVERWDAEQLLRAIERHGVTTTLMVPTMFVRMLKLPRAVRERYSTTSLVRVVHVGASCPPDVKRQMIDWWGPVLWDTYGAAEGSGTIVSSEEWCRYPGTVGKPIPGSKVAILDDDGNRLPPGEIGNVYLTRYTGDAFEYKGDPEKTRACHRGELFTVGDVGYLNEEGYLFLCDRKIDVIISGGMNIYSAEIERVLILHPKVADCAVLRMPDPLLGEAAKAIVQPQPGASPSRELTADIMSFLRERISTTKLPKRIEYLEQLPRDPNGKLYKRLLT